jgi:hypothetical protein
MKWTTIAFLLILPGFLHAQDYQQICSPGITFFQAQDGYLSAFRRDSAYAAGTGDSIFLSYRAIRDSVLYSCKDTTNGALLGLKVCQRSGGEFLFFNRFHDTLHLNTQAALSQSWNFFSLGNGSRIEATVTQVTTDNVLGIPDPVKVITFQAKDASNQNIPHLMNGREIRLSGHYGLSQMYDVYLFPTDTTLYVLCGKTGASLGLPDLTMAMVYDFEPGDEYQYYGHDAYYPSASKDYFIMKKILSKETFGNNDSVAYLEEYCMHSMLYTQYGVITENIYDTVTEGFNLLLNQNLMRLPREFAPGDFFSGGGLLEYKRTVTPYNGKTTQECYSGDYFSYPPPCWMPPFEDSGLETYSDGLGLTRTWTGYAVGGGMETYQLDLVYFKKGSSEWGFPVAVDCMTLVPVPEPANHREISVTVIPNPVETSAEIRITGVERITGLEFCLVDLMGKRLICLPVTNGSVTFQRQRLSGGLYLGTITDTNGSPFWSGKVLLK